MSVAGEVKSSLARTFENLTSPRSVEFLLVMFMIVSTSVGGTWGDLWLARWGWVLISIVVAMFAKSITIGRLLAAYLLLNGIAYTYLVYPHMHDLPSAAIDALRLSATDATLCLSLALMGVVTISHENIATAKWVIAEVGAVMSALVILSHFTAASVRWHVPLFDNPSMGGSLIGLALPFMLERARRSQVALAEWGVLVLAFIAVALTRAIAPALVYLTVVAVIYWRSDWIKGLVVVSGVLVLKYFPLGDSGRFEVWKSAISHWRESGHMVHAFGFGLGSAQVMTPLWHTREGTSWLFLHNDWLQLLIETGLFGFGLATFALAAIVMTLLKRSGQKYALAGLIGFAALMLINPPLHYPVHALIGIVLLRESIVLARGVATA